VPLPVGLRRREDGVGGSRTLASDRARIAGWPAAQPHEPTEKESNLRLPGFNRALAPSQLSVDWRPARESNPPLRRCKPPDAPLSYLAAWIGEKDSNPHCLGQSEVACRLADPRMTSCVRAFRRVFAFHSSGYLPAVGLPSRRACLLPLGPVTTGRLNEAPGPARIAPLCESSQAAPGFPGLPREDSNLPIPPGGPAREAHEKGRPAGPPPIRTYVMPSLHQ
jgi:hypothetical protein